MAGDGVLRPPSDEPEQRDDRDERLAALEAELARHRQAEQRRTESQAARNRARADALPGNLRTLAAGVLESMSVEAADKWLSDAEQQRPAAPPRTKMSPPSSGEMGQSLQSRRIAQKQEALRDRYMGRAQPPWKARP